MVDFNLWRKDKMEPFDYRYRPRRSIENTERPLVRFLKILYSKIWNLTKLNLLYLLFLLPTYAIVFLLSGIVIGGTFAESTNIYAPFYEIFVRVVITSFFTVLWGMGPATGGITSVLMKFVKEEHSFVWSDFLWKYAGNIRNCYKHIDYICNFCVYNDAFLYLSNNGILRYEAYIYLL